MGRESVFANANLSDLSNEDWLEVERGVKIALAPIMREMPEKTDDLALGLLSQAMAAQFKAEVMPSHAEFGASANLNETSTLSQREIEEKAAAAGVAIPPFLMQILITMFSGVVDKLIKRWAAT